MFALEEDSLRKVAFNTNKVRLRKESKRVLVYKIDPEYRTTDLIGFISPAPAIFLALCNGKRTEWEVVDAFRYVFGLPDWSISFVTAKHIAESLSRQYGPDIFVDATSGLTNSGFKEYNPLDFVIDSKRVDIHGLRLEAPLDLNFIVTQDCYRRCVYCYAETTVAPSFDSVSVGRFAELMEEARDIEINSIIFGGGEPFYRKDIIELLRLAIDANLWPFVSTKAYLTKRVCRKLRDINVPLVQVSIDSDRYHVADFLAGSDRYFRQITATIRNLREYGIPIKAKTVLTPFNVFDIRGILRFLFKLGIERLQFVRYGRSAFRHRDNLFVDNDALKYARDEIESFRQEHPHVRLDYNFRAGDLSVPPAEIDRTERFSKRAVCSVGRLGLTILPDGRAFACEQLPTRDDFCFGDLRTQSIKDVWNSANLKNIVVPPRELFKDQACYDCELFVECHAHKGRCMRNAYILYGNAYAPDPLCPKAPPPSRQE